MALWYIVGVNITSDFLRTPFIYLKVLRYDHSALVWSYLAPHKNVSLEKQNVLFCVPVMIGIVMFQDG